MITTTLLTALLTVSPAEGDTLSIRADAGTKVTRTFSIESSSELVEQTQMQDGEEMGGMMPEMNRSSAQAQSWTVVDTIEEAEDGAATKFLRTYESIEGEASFEMSMDAGDFGEGFDESDERTLTSELAENAVRFEAGDDGFEASLPDDSELDAELLEGLGAELDLAFLLPEEAVAEKDTWEVEPGALAELMDLGGDLHMKSDEDDAEDMPDGAISMDEFGDGEESEFSGALTMTHAGYRDVDGRKMVVVRIQVDVTESASFSPEMEDMNGDAPEGAVMPSSMEITNEDVYEGEGELLFDIEAGLITSLELELDVEATSNQLITLDIPQMGEIEIDSTDVEEEKASIAYTASIG